MKRTIFYILAAVSYIVVAISSFIAGKHSGSAEMPSLAKDSIDLSPASNDYYVFEEPASYPYKISREGAELIKSFEGFSETPYLDNNKGWSIGYGHFYLKKSDCPEKISRSEAEELFLIDLEDRSEMLCRLLNEGNKMVKYPQSFIDGLGSIIYNYGEANTRKTKLFDKIKRIRCDKAGNPRKDDFEYVLSFIRDNWKDNIALRRRVEYDYIRANMKVVH